MFRYSNYCYIIICIINMVNKAFQTLFTVLYTFYVHDISKFNKPHKTRSKPTRSYKVDLIFATIIPYVL